MSDRTGEVEFIPVSCVRNRIFAAAPGDCNHHPHNRHPGTKKAARGRLRWFWNREPQFRPWMYCDTASISASVIFFAMLRIIDPASLARAPARKFFSCNAV